jgi:putative ATP-dependent endonuclease of the OLD family
MKISKIKIENFRSIKYSEFNLNNFNIIIGQNNCGKTNFFEAIEYFFNGVGKSNIDDFKFKRMADNHITVEIEFTGALEGVEKMQNQANKTKVKAALGESDTVTIIRSSLSTKRKMFVNGRDVTPGTGIDPALNDFLPKFEYISTKQYYDSVAKYGKTTPIGVMLSGVLTTILQENEPYREFQKTFRNLFEDENSQIRAEFDKIGNQVKVYLERQFPDCTKVKFEVTAPAFDDLLKNFDTTVNDGVETLAEEKGDGMQRALMLAIIQAYADFRRQNEDVGKSFLFFIDEAELHLHPTAQRKLKDVLYGLSQQNDQVFINTHSSVFVVDEYSSQTIFKAEKHNGETSIDQVAEFQKPYVIFELLGGSPSDLLLPRNFLIVEGLSEFELFSRVIARFYSDKPSVHILPANGDVDQTERTINAIDKIFSPLNMSIYKNRLVILTDLPSEERQEGVKSFLRSYPHLSTNNQFYSLDARDIEQCYPNQQCDIYGNWRKSQSEVDSENEMGKKLFNSRKKRQLAKHVGSNITQDQFEKEMSICFEALKKCWQAAYN